VTNPGGTIAQTKADLSTLTFTVANNPFSMNLLVVNPDDPTLKGGFQGKLSFLSISLPRGGMRCSGK
jgi:hypothetical protein